MGACAQLLVPGLTVDKVVVLCILVNAYTTYPCLVLVIQARAPAGLNPFIRLMHFPQHSFAMPSEGKGAGCAFSFSSHLYTLIQKHHFAILTNMGNAPQSFQPMELPSSINISCTA